MAQVTFVIPDNQSNRMTLTQMLDNFCTYHNYNGSKESGETKLQFFRRKTIEWWLVASRAPAILAAQQAVVITEPPDIPA